MSPTYDQEKAAKAKKLFDETALFNMGNMIKEIQDDREIRELMWTYAKDQLDSMSMYSEDTYDIFESLLLLYLDYKGVKQLLIDSEHNFPKYLDNMKAWEINDDGRYECVKLLGSWKAVLPYYENLAEQVPCSAAAIQELKNGEKFPLYEKAFNEVFALFFHTSTLSGALYVISEASDDALVDAAINLMQYYESLRARLYRTFIKLSIIAAPEANVGIIPLLGLDNALFLTYVNEKIWDRKQLDHLVQDGQSFLEGTLDTEIMLLHHEPSTSERIDSWEKIIIASNDSNTNLHAYKNLEAHLKEAAGDEGLRRHRDELGTLGKRAQFLISKSRRTQDSSCEENTAYLEENRRFAHYANYMKSSFDEVVREFPGSERDLPNVADHYTSIIMGLLEAELAFTKALSTPDTSKAQPASNAKAEEKATTLPDENRLDWLVEMDPISLYTLMREYHYAFSEFAPYSREELAETSAQFVYECLSSYKADETTTNVAEMAVLFAGDEMDTLNQMVNYATILHLTVAKTLKEDPSDPSLFPGTFGAMVCDLAKLTPGFWETAKSPENAAAFLEEDGTKLAAIRENADLILSLIEHMKKRYFTATSIIGYKPLASTVYMREDIEDIAQYISIVTSYYIDCEIVIENFQKAVEALEKAAKESAASTGSDDFLFDNLYGPAALYLMSEHANNPEGLASMFQTGKARLSRNEVKFSAESIDLYEALIWLAPSDKDCCDLIAQGSDSFQSFLLHHNILAKDSQSGKWKAQSSGGFWGGILSTVKRMRTQISLDPKGLQEYRTSPKFAEHREIASKIPSLLQYLTELMKRLQNAIKETTGKDPEIAEDPILFYYDNLYEVLLSASHPLLVLCDANVGNRNYYLFHSADCMLLFCHMGNSLFSEEELDTLSKNRTDMNLRYKEPSLSELFDMDEKILLMAPTLKGKEIAIMGMARNYAIIRLAIYAGNSNEKGSYLERTILLLQENAARLEENPSQCLSEQREKMEASAYTCQILQDYTSYMQKICQQFAQQKPDLQGIVENVTPYYRSASESLDKIQKIFTKYLSQPLAPEPEVRPAKETVSKAAPQNASEPAPKATPKPAPKPPVESLHREEPAPRYPSRPAKKSKKWLIPVLLILLLAAGWKLYPLITGDRLTVQKNTEDYHFLMELQDTVLQSMELAEDPNVTHEDIFAVEQHLFALYETTEFETAEIETLAGQYIQGLRLQEKSFSSIHMNAQLEWQEGLTTCFRALMELKETYGFGGKLKKNDIDLEKILELEEYRLTAYQRLDDQTRHMIDNLVYRVNGNKLGANLPNNTGYKYNLRLYFEYYDENDNLIMESQTEFYVLNRSYPGFEIDCPDSWSRIWVYWEVDLESEP